MHYDTRAQFWFKPSGFWWHDIASISDINKLLHAHRI